MLGKISASKDSAQGLSSSLVGAPAQACHVDVSADPRAQIMWWDLRDKAYSIAGSKDMRGDSGRERLSRGGDL